MKAILRWGTGLFGLLLLASICHAYYWVTPVTKCPYPQAPNTRTAAFFLIDACGRVTGPHYYLVPPCPPFQGVLPGPVGQAIQGGNLPHTLLTSQQGSSLGNMPMLGQKSAPPAPMGMNGPPMGNPYGQMPPPGYGQFGQMQPFGQAQPFNQMQPFNQFSPMQAPSMGAFAPPPPPPHGAPYPTHPFTRSPRDFFMWGDVMQEERARGNRPFPVP